MSGLSPDAKLLVAQARGQGNPSREDRARLQAKLAPAWAAYEREQEMHGARSARTWWSASAARWLLCVSLSWLGQPTPPRHGPDAAPSLVSLSPSAAQPVAAVEGAVVQLSAADATPAPELPVDVRRSRALRGLPLRVASTVLGRGASERDEARARLAPGGSASARTPSEQRAHCANAPADRLAPGGSASVRTPSEQLGRCVDAPARLAPGSSASARTPSEQLAHGTTGSPDQLAPSSSTEPVLADAPRPQPRAAPSPELVRAGPALPEHAGPQFVPQPIGDELELLGVAQDALRKHQPSVALRLVQQHAFRFPRGALSRERQAVQVLALCALQRVGPARTVFEGLRENASESPMLESVRRACGF